MKQNIGSADKVVRFVLAAVLFSLILLLQGSVRWIGLVGFVPLLTAVFGTCPLYTLLGISTCSRSNKMG